MEHQSNRFDGWKGEMAEIQLTPETPVGNIVASYPAAVPMFEAMGIDYCCGGKRSLAEAAGDAKMPVDRVIAILETTITQEQRNEKTTQDWQHAPLNELMTYIIEVHHAYMYHELPRLSDLMQKVQRAHGAVHGELLDQLAQAFSNLRAELEAHLNKEEAVTFPAISQLAAGSCETIVQQAVTELENEHDRAGELLAAMRVMTDEYTPPEDACATFRQLYTGLQALEHDLHRHIHLENNILFPRVHQLIAACGKKAA